MPTIDVRGAQVTDVDKTSDAMPTVEQIRHAFVSKGLIPVQCKYNLHDYGGKFIVTSLLGSTRECCALSALVCGESCVFSTNTEVNPIMGTIWAAEDVAKTRWPGLQLLEMISGWDYPDDVDAAATPSKVLGRDAWLACRDLRDKP